MSGLGHLLIDLGHRVVGSDLVVNEETRQLRARGAEIHPAHAAEQLHAARPALVVYTSAVRWDNPELQAAENCGSQSCAGRFARCTAKSATGICVAACMAKRPPRRCSPLPWINWV
jgi:UDP-N-acetylmuramate-alanine ligase